MGMFLPIVCCVRVYWLFPYSCTLSRHDPVPLCLSLFIGGTLQVVRKSLDDVKDDH